MISINQQILSVQVCLRRNHWLCASSLTEPLSTHCRPPFLLLHHPEPPPEKVKIERCWYIWIFLSNNLPGKMLWKGYRPEGDTWEAIEGLSMGGLVVKQRLHQASVENRGNLIKNTIGVKKVTLIVEGYGGWAFRLEIVTIEATYPGYGEHVVLELTDHVNSCKLITKIDPSYSETLQFLHKLRVASSKE
ncbi:unnamed protein product [Lactuca saligna]|uniref:Uncharacterized protein n=1 Tax=Lactuca saligna TaxID=75948 RepID=A0AA35VJ57_LACSI|nr:unnamed protein product [Lactuca saligna]